MKNDIEYPATHSMSTAWFFVDQDDNVAIVAMEANGPIPLEAMESDNSIDSLAYDDMIVEHPMGKRLIYTDEQAKTMFEDAWQDEIKDGEFISYLAVQIDPAKKEYFLKSLEKAKKEDKEENQLDDFLVPIAISEHHGIYYMCVYKCYSNKNSSEELDIAECNVFARMKEQGIVLRMCPLPEWDNLDTEEPSTDEYKMVENRCPFYIYVNDYNYVFPHKRVSIPSIPVSLDQMPEAMKDKIIRLPFKFSETEHFQLASEHPCYTSAWHDIVNEAGELFVKMQIPTGEFVYVMNYDIHKEELVEKNLLTFKAINEHFGRPTIIDSNEANRLKDLPENSDYKEYDD